MWHGNRRNCSSVASREIMLSLLENMKQLYICCGYVDMRKGIEGLAGVVQIKYGKQIEHCQPNVYNNHVSETAK